MKKLNYGEDREEKQDGGRKDGGMITSHTQMRKRGSRKKDRRIIECK